MKTILFGNGPRLCVSLLTVLFTCTRSDASDSRSARTIAVFLNGGPRTVQINVVSADGKETTVMTLSPDQIGSSVTVAGEARIYAPSKNMMSGRLLSSCSVPSPDAARRFFEESSGTFFFRIARDKVKLIAPRDLTVGERRRLDAYYAELKRAGIK
jgi:hypothetical protein